MTGLRKTLFIYRDGTLLVEPPDAKLDSLAKVELLPGVMAALLRLRSAGFRLVMVSNAYGPGPDRLPPQSFREVQDFLIRLLASQGIAFDAQFVGQHEAAQGGSDPQPATGPLEAHVREQAFDPAASYVIGNRERDLELAHKLGIPALRVSAHGPPEETWEALANRLTVTARRACVHRKTRETDVSIHLDLGREIPVSVATGIGFYDHMLEQIARHAGFSLELACRGDLRIDEHHTVEDCALALGQALREALGDKRGMGRYGFVLPMDESLASVAIDIGGRPYAVFEGSFSREKVGDLPTELVPHFFRSLAESLGAAIHITVTGENTHHMVEACFKGMGRALRQAVRVEGTELPSSKGVL